MKTRVIQDEPEEPAVTAEDVVPPPSASDRLLPKPRAVTGAESTDAPDHPNGGTQ
jgi:hypothetical protein